jgi:hypothetical protein
MPAKHLETSVRLKPGGAVLDLHGEINGFAQEALNAAYTEAEAKTRRPSSSTSRRWTTSTRPGSS